MGRDPAFHPGILGPHPASTGQATQVELSDEVEELFGYEWEGRFDGKTTLVMGEMEEQGVVVDLAFDWLYFLDFLFYLLYYSRFKILHLPLASILCEVSRASLLGVVSCN